MLDRKLVVLTIFFVLLFAVSAVNAAQNDADDAVVETSRDSISAEKAYGVALVDDNQAIMNDNDVGNFTELSGLIESTPDGTTLELDKNYKYVNGSNGGIQINKSITIDGKGHVVDGSQIAIAFNVGSNVTLKNINFVNCYASSLNSKGGAIYWNGENGVLTNCSFVNCISNGVGGAVGWFGPSGHLYNCSFMSCSATSSYSSPEFPSRLQGGAIYWNGENGLLSNCSFEDCSAKITGGAIYLNYCSNVTVCDCSFVNGSANVGNAIYLNYCSNVTVCDCSFVNGSKGRTIDVHGDYGSVFNCRFVNCYRDVAIEWNGKYGFLGNSSFINCSFTNSLGAVRWIGDNGFIFNCSFSNCFANYSNPRFREGGGAIDCRGNNCTISKCSFSDCSSYYGGAIKGGLVYNCTFVNCSAFSGGAINGNNISNCSFVNCSADFGGAVFWEGRYAYVSDSSFMKCTSKYNGGAIMLNADYGTVFNCSFVNCSSNAGGAIYWNVETSPVVDSHDGTVSYCSFVNCSANQNGGAIGFYGKKATVHNSDFRNCFANHGGAIANADASNCTFVSNRADFGGAMYGGGHSAEWCRFTNNTANSGGAAYQIKANYCHFTINAATENGGAMYEGSAANSNFTQNRAGKDAGALYNVLATGCLFEHNSAGNGGAMYNGTATNCTFNNCSAVNYGGAMANADAFNCTFVSNRADFGGAMYGGTATNCIFKDNKACISGDDIHDIIMPKPVLNVFNFSSSYGSGDRLLFIFTNASGSIINDVNITIRVYANNTLVGTYYSLSGEGWVVSVGAGSYLAVCSVEDHEYKADSANATLTITKASTILSSQSVTSLYNGGKYLTAYLKDANGKPVVGAEIIININTPKTLTTDKNGQVKLSTNGLKPVKTYAATITFVGNDNYTNASEIIAKVTVKKATPKMTAKAKTFKRTVKTKKYTIALKTNQNKVMKNTKVSIKVNKKTYFAKTNSKGIATFKITKLTKKGKYAAVITYKGSSHYNKSIKKVKITVK